MVLGVAVSCHSKKGGLTTRPTRRSIEALERRAVVAAHRSSTLMVCITTATVLMAVMSLAIRE